MHLKGKRSIIVNTFLIIIVIMMAIAGVLNLLGKKKKLEHYGTVTGKVIWLGSTAGNRVGQPELKCEFTVNGMKMADIYEQKDLKLKIGDCIEIRYSLEDSKITDINYDKGVVVCSP